MGTGRAVVGHFTGPEGNLIGVAGLRKASAKRTRERPKPPKLTGRKG
jgi:hypothetical protein